MKRYTLYGARFRTEFQTVFLMELGIILLQAQRSNTTIMSTFNTVEYNPFEEHYH